ncbi:MAG: MFS transporter [Actinomycetota bacterium]
MRHNLAQFSLLVAVNALVGGMVGQERTILPLIAERVFHVGGFTVVLTFLVAFGLVKAATNLFAGTYADRFGRKPLLVAGWLIGIPVPLILIWAPSWRWIVVANVFLGVNQGLAWSMTVTMKIDLAGQQRRGLAMGFNEAAGYGTVAITAAATGYIAARWGLRPEPFFLGIAFAALGFGLSSLFVRETRDHALAETDQNLIGQRLLSFREVFKLTTYRDRALSSCCQAGMVNNLNDGMAWGLFPIWFSRGGLTIASIATLAALYPAVWGVGQLVTGWLSDKIGRKKLIAWGMALQAAALGIIGSTRSFAPWAAGAILLGAGTAMVYPTLLACIADVADPSWRASSVGIYRLWRDLGFAFGGLLAGVAADFFGIATAIWTVAVLTAASGLIVAFRMYETHPASDQLK